MSDAAAAGTPVNGAAGAPQPAIGGEIARIASELRAKFGLPAEAVKIQRATRLWCDVERERLPDVFDALVKGMGFTILCTITGLDLGADLGFIYHLAREGGIMVNVKSRCPKGQAMRSMTPYFPGAAIYEREIEDLLGARIEGLPSGPRYPLPEDWPEGDHPLLKDWGGPPAEGPQAGGQQATADAEKGAQGNV